MTEHGVSYGELIATLRQEICDDAERLESAQSGVTFSDVDDYLASRVRTRSERGFADTLTKTLGERDAKLIEIEREANARLQLLNESSQDTARLERLLYNLTTTLEVNGQALTEYARRLELADVELLALREGKVSMDVFELSDPIVLSGSGWHAYETFGEDSFRWVGDNARFNVALLTRAPYDLVIDVEPGPAVGNKPFDLVVLESGTQIAMRKISGRERIRISLGSGDPTVKTLEIHAANAAPPLPAPGDPRVLKFRIFGLGIEIAGKDVVALAEGLVASKGWYPIEEYAGETFRWAGPEVTIERQHGAYVESLMLDIEPGPGVNFGPIKLQVFAGETLHGEVTVTNRAIVEIPWPQGTNGSPMRLRVEGGGKMIATDPRVMNFRAFVRAD